jgi:hypothetical protein
VVVGLERGLLSLMSTIEELFERKISGFGLENRDYGHRDLSCLPRGTLNPHKLALTSPTNTCSSVGIVCFRTQATEYYTCEREPYSLLIRFILFKLFYYDDLCF